MFLGEVLARLVGYNISDSKFEILSIARLVYIAIIFNLCCLKFKLHHTKHMLNKGVIFFVGFKGQDCNIKLV